MYKRYQAGGDAERNAWFVGRLVAFKRISQVGIPCMSARPAR